MYRYVVQCSYARIFCVIITSKLLICDLVWKLELRIKGLVVCFSPALDFKFHRTENEKNPIFAHKRQRHWLLLLALARSFDIYHAILRIWYMSLK